jgi:hypothetical protein
MPYEETCRESAAQLLKSCLFSQLFMLQVRGHSSVQGFLFKSEIPAHATGTRALIRDFCLNQRFMFVLVVRDRITM